MRRRVLTATMMAVAVAVALLGVPMAIGGALMTRDSVEQNLQIRTAAVARQVDRFSFFDFEIDEGTLQLWMVDSPLPIEIIVVQPDGVILRAGEELSGQPTISAVAFPNQGGQVTIYMSGTALAWKMAQVVIFVVLAGAVAFGAAALLAGHQARRLAAPLIYLAASAEQIGSGQVRPRIEESGVEEIDLVAAELARTSDRMAARLATERQFAADASHQLRTPLTALSMRLEEIEMLASEEDVRAEAHIALEQIERLVTVVDDLLANSRKAKGGSTEIVHLAEIFTQQRAEWQPTFERAGRRLELPTDTPDVVFASPGALAQVLATLFENSLKYGDGLVLVTSRTSGHSVVIEVSDEGEGVPEDLAPRIFERSVTAGKGTGLGLGLARDLVAADGGRLELIQAVPAVFAIFLSAVPAQLDPDLVLPKGSLVAVGGRRRRR